MMKRTSTHRTLALTSLVLVAAMLAAPYAGAQQHPQPGTRITYYSASATTQGSPTALRPNAQGGWDQLDISGSAAGEGYLQVDILYVDDQVCAGIVTNYTYDRSVGLLLNSSQSGFVSERGRCYDAWIAPATLLAMPLDVTPERSVVRGTETIGGQTLDVLRTNIATSSANNMTVHDLASGFLLSTSSSSAQTVLTAPLEGGLVTPATGRTLLTSNRFLDVRQLGLPASNAPLPQHVRSLRTLHYDCVSGSADALFTLQNPCSHRLDVVGGGPGLLRMRATTYLSHMGGFPLEEDWVVSSTPNVDNVYVPSEYLRSLTPGQVLDQDPITGVRTSVLHVDARVAVLARQGAHESIRTTYELATGWLLESVKEQQIGTSVYFTNFALARVE